MKCFFKQERICFFHNKYTANGIVSNTSEVPKNHNMPNPENKDDLHRFLGMMTYLSVHCSSTRISISDDVQYVYIFNYPWCITERDRSKKLNLLHIVQKHNRIQSRYSNIERKCSIDITHSWMAKHTLWYHISEQCLRNPWGDCFTLHTPIT